MNLTKIKLITIVCIFALAFLSHQIYGWFPNTFFSIFFPVNESIWEHLKMIFSTYVLFMPFEYLLYKNTHLEFNVVISFFIAMLNAIIFLIIYVPVYNSIGYNTAVTFIIYFISVVLSQLIYYLIQNRGMCFATLNKLTPVFISLVFIMFGILTYKAPKKPIFYDEFVNKYGVHSYYD